MSETDRDSSVARWGRPMRKRSRGPKPASSASDPGFVGLLGDAVPAGGDPAVIRSTAGVPPARPTLSPPAPRRDPDEIDFKLRDLVATMAAGVVDHPDQVRVVVLEADPDPAFELHVHPDDLGHVIGKQGRTARSLRLALGAAASKVGRRASLEIAD